MKLRVSLIAAALILSSLPVLYGWVNARPGSVYTGMKGLNATDFNANLAWIEQCRHGSILLKNLYSHEFQQGFMIRPVYFLISLPFGLTSFSNGVVYHIERIVCGLVLLWVLFILLGRLTPWHSVVWIAFALLAFTSGLGFLFISRLDHPIDLTVPEATLFLSLGEAPHFLYCLLLLWTGATAFYTAARDGRRMPWLPLICLFVLWWEHPYDALTLSAIGAASAILRPAWRDRMWTILSIGGAAIAPVIYYKYLFALPAFAGWAAQNVLVTPPVISLLTAYAPLILLAIPGVVHLHRNGDRKLLWFLVLWIGAQILLVYLPFSFQRRSLAGLQFPLALLAAVGLARLHRPVLIAAVILLTASGSLWSTWQQALELKPVRMPFYLPEDYAETFNWLRTQEPGVVLSAYVTGNFIPAWTGFPVYIGHSIQTADIAEKRKRVAAFFAQPTQEFLEREHIRYIFYGREERPLALPGMEPKFQAIYNRNGIIVLSPWRP